MRVLLYGGAFDPPTIGHEEVLDKVFYSDLNKDFNLWEFVWIIPSNEGSFGKKLSNPVDRLSMCINSNLNRLRSHITAVEMYQNITGGTINLIRLLKKVHPHNEFSMMIGIDQALLFHKWDEYKELKKLVKFVVVPRYKYECPKDAWFLEEPHMYAPVDITNEISSTIVREKIKKGESITGLVSPGVERYIRKGVLYVV